MSTPYDDIDPESYADLAEIARQITLAETHLDAPPADLWSRIEAAIDNLSDEDTRRAPEGLPGDRSIDSIDSIDSNDSNESSVATLPFGTTRRSRRRRWVMGIAAAILAVSGLTSVVVSRSRNGDNGTTVAQVALANAGGNPALDPLGANSTGVAKLVSLPDGEYALDVDVSRLPAPGSGFFELWMIDTAVHDMVSLGPITQSRRILLPSSVDPSRFPVVDISIEPNDGKPTHSGKSILRGVLSV